MTILCRFWPLASRTRATARLILKATLGVMGYWLAMSRIPSVPNNCFHVDDLGVSKITNIKINAFVIDPSPFSKKSEDFLFEKK